MAQVELKTYAVVTAGGVGKRMGSAVAKQFLSIGSRSILSRSIENLSRWPALSGIVVTAPADSLEETRKLIEKDGLTKVLRVVAGGVERQSSVMNGLMALFEAGDADMVLIHDGVRPFPPIEKLDELIAAAVPQGAIIALPSTDTVKICRDGKIEKTFERQKVWLAQTPQAFPYGLILKAHKLAEERGFLGTDDSSLAEAMGLCPRVVEGTRSNIKITTPEDLKLARSALDAPALSIGHGYDAHRLVEGRDLILGGVKIDHAKGLLGHSDADVLAHAVADACLGGAGLGDIGRHFPDTDGKYKNADSIELLRKVGALVRASGMRVMRVDATLIAQKPKVAPFIARMEQNLSAALGLGERGVTVKATTTEKMGFEGREEGISAHAVALLESI